VILFQDRAGMSTATLDGTLSGITASGLGDARVAAKWWVLRQARHGLDLALVPAVTVPTQTDAGAYLGDTGLGVAPEVVLTRRQGRVRLALDLGYRARPTLTVANLTVGDELTSRAGVGVALTPSVEWGVTASLATAASAPFADANRLHAEALTGVTYGPAAPVQLIAAGGLGLAGGYGTPDSRVVLAARYQPAPPARRPTAAVRRLEVIAPTPTPTPLPPPDADGDGASDLADACPDLAEDLDGVADADGCPDLDDDGDGVLEPADRCPEATAPASADGCPAPDGDDDGTDDAHDVCPSEAGPSDQSGCPARPQVALQDGVITTLEPVYFDSRLATIQARSYALLDEVAAVLTSHPALRVRIEGHTDDRGGGAANRDLSERRAAAVRAYLVDRGIAADRLAAQGFGEAQPIADNRTEAGRASNRRVVFAIIPPAAP
jgi:outer membrane protein OmpA-like peptidoglycan-associated protein